MANCTPPLDNLARIKQSINATRHCQAIPVSAITKNLAGKELVNINQIRPYVAGFSDDGKYLADLNLLEAALKTGVLVMAHCSPPYSTGIKKPELETEYIKRYLRVLKNTKGRLHIQHVSKKDSVRIIRQTKKQGRNVTCETCPHYFTFTNEDLEVKVNPPLASDEDVLAIKKGLADNTIDVIASDFAPLPRETGIAGFKSFIPLSYGLVLEGVLTLGQLKEKLYSNPKKIIQSGGYKLKIF